MWPQFDNCSISIREVILTSILYRLEEKTLNFLKSALGLSLII